MALNSYCPLGVLLGSVVCRATFKTVVQTFQPQKNQLTMKSVNN